MCPNYSPHFWRVTLAGTFGATQTSSGSEIFAAPPPAAPKEQWQDISLFTSIIDP